MRKPIKYLVLVAVLGLAGCATSTRIPEGFTPLHVAARDGKTAEVKTLIASGANVNAASPKNGVTPLHLAAMKGHPDVVHLLIEAGAAVNSREPQGDTPLMFAAWGGYDPIVSDLLNHGADVDARSDAKYSDWTALIAAASKSHPSTVKLLLDAGADPNIRAQRDGGTALMWAAADGYNDVVRLLLEHGADIQVKAFGGHTACDLAAEDHHEAVIALLKERARTLGVEISCSNAPPDAAR